MKFLFIFLGLIALTSSIRLRGVVSTTPTITIASQPEYQEIPMIPTLSSQIPIKTQIGQGYYYTVSIISQNSPFIKSKSRSIYIYFSFFIIESIIKKMITDRCADALAHTCWK